MRNLKKLLALVLAMVMAFSLMLSASAAANFDDEHFSDTEEVTQEFKEAVAVLTGLEVLKGDGDGDIKAIRPQSEITRAEAAALVYRIATGDINDKQVGLYADYSNFTDVKPRTADDPGDWFAGYVGYCQNAKIIKGTTPTTFNPYGKVTGYEVLAMILRAVGYGRNDEFTGASWQVEVASLAKTKHISDSVTSVLYEGELQNYTLNKNARREIVAELLFRGSLIPQVKWTPGLGYVEYENGITDPTTYLADDVFGLKLYPWETDDWGRPQLVWKANLNPTGLRTVATLTAEPKQSFHDEQRECDVAELMEFGKDASRDYILYVNNDVPVTDTYHIVATDTVTKVGGYGRITEIYTQEYIDEQFPWHSTDTYWATENGNRAPEDTIVMIDTIVAKVTNTTEVVLDPAGHVITPAKMTVALYDGDKNAPNTRIISKAKTSKDNWEFSIGDVLSLQGFTEAYKTSDEREAFRTTVLPGTPATILYEDTDVVNITKMTGTSGKQTLVYRNTNEHQVDGVNKTDDLTLKLDKAGDNVNTSYIWYYDQFGYVQAIDEGSATYGVITSIYTAFGTGENSTTGTAQAIATVKFSNGATDTVTIDRFLVKGEDADARSVKDEHTSAMEDRLVDGASDNATELWPVYDVVYSTEYYQPMEPDDLPGGLTMPKTNADVQGFVYMAPAAVSNSNSHHNTQKKDLKGILYDNLFKFVKTANDQMVAVEVAGNADNTGVFADNRGAYTDHDGDNGRLIKSLSVVSGKNDSTEPLVWIDDDTKILVRNINNESITFYDGVSALPGDVVIPKSASEDLSNDHFDNEIDWADTDGDGRAEVLYITGTIDGTTTYGLFYYNDGNAAWNGSTGTLEGFLNGEQTTLTFTSYAQYTAILNSTNTYKGHLFAVKQTNGVVADVLERNSAEDNAVTDTDVTHWTAELLRDWDGTAAAFVNATGEVFTDTVGKNFSDNIFQSGFVSVGGNHNAADFELGASAPKWGNPYSATTQAVYYEDTIAVDAAKYQLRWVPEIVGTTGTIEVRCDDNGDGDVDDAGDLKAEYYINPGTKIWGLGSGVTSGALALEYLNESVVNDVTIVYNTTSSDPKYAVLEVYIATDPNITPNNPSTGTVTAAKPDTSTVTAVAPAKATPSETELNTMVTGLSNQAVILTGDDVTNIGSDVAAAQDLIVFPFYASEANKAVSLVVKNSSNKIVWQEGYASPTLAIGWHHIRIDMTGAHAHANAVVAQSLGADTYTFEVNYNGVVVSSGSFTLK